MKTYELETWTDEIDGTTIGRVIATDAEGNKKNIPLDPANSDYAEYLRLQDWLAEGKDEADFWNQSEVI